MEENYLSEIHKLIFRNNMQLELQILPSGLSHSSYRFRLSNDAIRRKGGSVCSFVFLLAGLSMAFAGGTMKETGQFSLYQWLFFLTQPLVCGFFAPFYLY